MFLLTCYSQYICNSCAIMPKNNSAYKESFAVCGCAKNVFWQCTKSRTRTKCPSITVIWDPLLPGHGRPVWEELDGVRWRELCVRQDRPPRVHHRLSVQVSVLYLGVLGLGSVPFHVKKYSRNIYKIVHMYWTYSWVERGGTYSKVYTVRKV